MLLRQWCGDKTVLTENQVAVTTSTTTAGTRHEIAMERGEDGTVTQVVTRSSEIDELQLAAQEEKGQALAHGLVGRNCCLGTT